MIQCIFPVFGLEGKIRRNMLQATSGFGTISSLFRIDDMSMFFDNIWIDEKDRNEGGKTMKLRRELIPGTRQGR